MYIHVYVIISHAGLPLQTKVVAIIYVCDEQCTQNLLWNMGWPSVFSTFCHFQKCIVSR